MYQKEENLVVLLVIVAYYQNQMLVVFCEEDLVMKSLVSGIEELGWLFEEVLAFVSGRKSSKISKEGSLNNVPIG